MHNLLCTSENTGDLDECSRILPSERILEAHSRPKFSRVLSHSSLRSLNQVHEESRQDSSQTSVRHVRQCNIHLYRSWQDRDHAVPHRLAIKFHVQTLRHGMPRMAEFGPPESRDTVFPCVWLLHDIELHAVIGSNLVELMLRSLTNCTIWITNRLWRSTPAVLVSTKESLTAFIRTCPIISQHILRRHAEQLLSNGQLRLCQLA
jgi:hypothetical protein